MDEGNQEKYTVTEFELIQEISRHQYDIDVFEIFDLLNEKYSKVKEEIGLDTSTLLKGYRETENLFIQKYSKKGYNIIDKLHHRNFIIPSNADDYHTYLAWKVLVMDPYKIGAMLSFQKAFFMGNIYYGKNDFINFVEFFVYEIVKSGNFLKEFIRQEKIMDWVERNRESYSAEVYHKKELNESELKDIRDVYFLDRKYADYFVQKLQQYFPINGDALKLRKLIMEGADMSNLVFIGTGNQLAELFKRLKYNNHIFFQTDKNLVDWLCRSFKTLKNDEKLPLDEDYLASILSKSDKEPPISKMILLEIAKYIPPDER